MFTQSEISENRPRRTSTKYVKKPASLIKRIFFQFDSLAYSVVLLPFVAFLPAPLAYGMAILRGDILSRWKKDSLKEVERSVELLFGSRFSQAKRRQIVQDFFRNQSCMAIDAVRLLGNGRALLRQVEMRGIENLKSALGGGKGAILLSAHLGSARCGFSLVGALGLPVTLIARWSFLTQTGILSRAIDRLEKGYPIRSHLRGPNILAISNNIGVAVKAADVLRRNEILGIMLDASAGSARPVQVGFLNGKATFSSGAVKIAQLTGAPVLMMVVHRSRRWSHLVLEISEPIVIDRDTQASFQRCLSMLEEAIERYPAQWSRLHDPTFLMLDFVPRLEDGGLKH